jgi:hypothetical protein
MIRVRVRREERGLEGREGSAGMFWMKWGGGGGGGVFFGVGGGWLVFIFG